MAKTATKKYPHVGPTLDEYVPDVAAMLRKGDGATVQEVCVETELCPKSVRKIIAALGAKEGEYRGYYTLRK